MVVMLGDTLESKTAEMLVRLMAVPMDVELGV